MGIIGKMIILTIKSKDIKISNDYLSLEMGIIGNNLHYLQA